MGCAPGALMLYVRIRADAILGSVTWKAKHVPNAPVKIKLICGNTKQCVSR